MSWYKVRPLVDWSGPRTPEGERRRRPFSATWSNTLELLRRELARIDARDVVLQLHVHDGDLRRDGMLRASARPSTPGVRLVADTKHGPLSWQTDVCTDWQSNVRSLGLGLEALRAVDRFGISQRGQQYRGYAELEAGTGATSAEDACAVLARAAYPNEPDEFQSQWAPKIATDPKIAAATYRQARLRSHPDHNDGDASRWHAVEAAARTLGLLR